MSKVYQKKMQIRDGRSDARDLLRKAQDLMATRFSNMEKGCSEYTREINKLKKKMQKDPMAMTEE